MTTLILIGASAGGVPALMQLTAALPSDFAAPVLVVLHVGARRSLLPTLLSRSSPLPVKPAEDGELLQPGCIYVAPPDCHLLVAGDRAVLSRGPKENHCRPAIDPLFRSAAIAHGADVIGVVLTGLLDDGTAGLQPIKRFGGTAVVQDPDDAYEPSMPRSALAHVEVDHCVPLALMPMLLATLVARAPAAAESPVDTGVVGHEQALTLNPDDVMQHLEAIGKPSTFGCPDCNGNLWEILDSRPTRYRCHTGHGFTARSLQKALGDASELAVWSALRALQERRVLLADMAAQHRAVGQEEEAARLDATAERLRAQGDVLKSMIEMAPPPVE